MPPAPGWTAPGSAVRREAPAGEAELWGNPPAQPGAESESAARPPGVGVGEQRDGSAPSLRRLGLQEGRNMKEGTTWAGQSQPQRSEIVFLPGTDGESSDCLGTWELP